MTTIRVDQVSRYYPPTPDGKGVLAVDNVSFTLSPGQTVALLGPSGCGKTTLLRLIAGLDKPTSGTVYYDDVPLGDISHRDRNIGMVFQDYALVPQWDARRNVGFFLRLRRREDEVPQRVRDVSDIAGVEIEQLLGKFPAHLSGGEKQRVAIARAFARDLAVLLLDEPFANLDAKFRAGARVALKRLLRRYPVTTALVTHDQQEAASVADRIFLMRDGMVVQSASYQQFVESPQTLFAAQFIGVPALSVFEGTVHNGIWQGNSFGGIEVDRSIPDNMDKSRCASSIL